MAGICGVMLTTLTLPSETWLLIVSSTRKNFSASMARPHRWLICENIHPAACADTAIELGAIAASRQPPCGWGRFRFGVEGSHSVVSGAISVDCMSYKDARTKQSQDYRNRFDHLTHPDTPPYVYWADPVSGWLRRVRKMFFVRSARQKRASAAFLPPSHPK